MQLKLTNRVNLWSCNLDMITDMELSFTYLHRVIHKYIQCFLFIIWLPLEHVAALQADSFALHHNMYLI